MSALPPKADIAKADLPHECLVSMLAGVAVQVVFPAIFVGPVLPRGQCPYASRRIVQDAGDERCIGPEKGAERTNEGGEELLPYERRRYLQERFENA